MKATLRWPILAAAAVLCGPQHAFAQAEPDQSTSLATSLGLIAYPSKSQSAETQSTDEAACYQWARQATGIDPMQPAQPSAANAQPEGGGAGGAGARGAVRGAAGAALIADIADADTSEAAWAGAVVGGARGRREKQVRSQAAQQEAQLQAEASSQQRRETFNKGFAACLEGKGYTVR